MIYYRKTLSSSGPKLTAVQHTVIPIRNLTMMFGPNGAGKSSIFDALELLKLLFSDN